VVDPGDNMIASFFVAFAIERYSLQVCDTDKYIRQYWLKLNIKILKQPLITHYQKFEETITIRTEQICNHRSRQPRKSRHQLERGHDHCPW